MKLLADGTEVPLDTPTKLTSEGRFLLTAQEIAEKQAQVLASQKLAADTRYIRDRQEAYTTRIGTTGDQLDAIWRALPTLGLQPDPIAPDGTPEKLLSEIAAIKSEFPKP